jgi:hypothetical protein
MSARPASRHPERRSILDCGAKDLVTACDQILRADGHESGPQDDE